MASHGDHEDGEIVEEEDDVSVSVSVLPTPSSSVQGPTPVVVSSASSPLLPTPSSTSRKRLHSSLIQSSRAPVSTSAYDTRPSLCHRAVARYRPSIPSNGYINDRRKSDDQQDMDRRVFYTEDLIIKYPRQEPRSHVLLNFATWMASVSFRKRLDVEDVRKLVLQVLRGGSRTEEGVVSPFLLPSLMPGTPLPDKVVMVLLEKMHPSVVQKYRPKLSFFDSCSSVPVVLTKQELNQVRRVEAPVPELVYRFPRPTVDTRELSMDELFYAHELTFLMKHSAGFTDELVLSPIGTFIRKTQPVGGTWELDGDLLHLKWRQRSMKVASGAEDDKVASQDVGTEEEDANAYTLDVLVSQDASMHEFRTDSVTDEAYAHKVPEHLAKKRRGNDKPRSIWLSLAKAIAVGVPRSADGTVIQHNRVQMNGTSKHQHDSTSADENDTEEKSEKEELKREAFEYYLLSLEEMKQHGYPIDAEEEQRQLMEATDGNTRDKFVATAARSTVAAEDSASGDDKEGAAVETNETMVEASESSCFIYALDCEMCETDIGMELTRVTVVDIKGTVVYDQLVKPQSTIINYHTAFSGISAETLQDTSCIVADVQRDLTTQFLSKDTILVGHSLTSDLRALRLVHLKIADTSILFPHQRGFPFRTSLKYLTKTYLKKDIQMQIEAGHDSAEDAIASLELLLMKVREGPWLGIPEAVSSSSAFDSIVDKVFALDKTMAMLRLQSSGKPEKEAPSDSGDNVASERKPWDLYASGDLKDQSQSPFCHAQAVKSKADACASVPSTTSAGALSKVELCSSWEVLKTSLQKALSTEQPDLCWVEIEPPSASAALCNDFVDKHESWMAEQKIYCEKVDAFLQQICDEALPKGTLLLVLPQGDLSLLRYLKGLRTRSKWRDSGPSYDDLAPEKLHAAVGDAFRGVMDSCLFMKQK
uniref:Exonuclease domain-containing protein n=1 Tax=Peronospora matthiolae TaxID=2874970 RepID=A0AAV1TKW9_9STRA